MYYPWKERQIMNEGIINLGKWDINGNPTLDLTLNKTRGEVTVTYEADNDKELAKISLLNNALIINTSEIRVSIDAATNRVDISSVRHNKYLDERAKTRSSCVVVVLVILVIAVPIIFFLTRLF